MNSAAPAGAEPERHRRILIIDDNSAIHDDFRKILGPDTANSDLADMESMLFGADQAARAPAEPVFELHFSHQGTEGLAAVEQALAAGAPFSVIFVDVRMPPGWDGFQTLERIFALDPAVQAVLCTAYSDYGWNELRARFGRTDRLLVLRKPFETIEVAQLAFALSEKWRREQELARATHALTQSEARMRALLDAVPDTLLRLDRSGRVLDHSRGRAQQGSTDLAAEAYFAKLCTQRQQSVIKSLLLQALDSGTPRESMVEADREHSGAYYHVNIAPLDAQEAVVLLRDVTRLRQVEHEQGQRRAREMALEMKLAELAKLSTPIIPLREGVLAVPLVGEFDELRADRLRETVLNSVMAQHARLIIVDLTGLPSLDAVVATELMRTAKAVRLLGAQTVFSGMSAQAARHVVTMGLDFHDVKIVHSLQTAIEWALRQ